MKHTIEPHKIQFGRYRGEYVSNPPSSYLVWVLDNCQNAEPALVLAVKDELAHFSLNPRPPKELLPIVETIVNSGFRGAALRFHPDQGGNNETFRLLVSACEWLTTNLLGNQGVSHGC